jgi:hypothetical protein
MTASDTAGSRAAATPPAASVSPPATATVTCAAVNLRARGAGSVRRGGAPAHRGGPSFTSLHPASPPPGQHPARALPHCGRSSAARSHASAQPSARAYRCASSRNWWAARGSPRSTSSMACAGEGGRVRAGGCRAPALRGVAKPAPAAPGRRGCAHLGVGTAARHDVDQVGGSVAQYAVRHVGAAPVVLGKRGGEAG